MCIRDRLILDRYGRPYPRLTPIDSARMAGSGYALDEYFKDDPSYDPERIFEDVAREASALCGRDRTLVVLIHGFNTTMPETRRAYKAARLQIEHQYPSRKFVVLEVYWD